MHRRVGRPGVNDIKVACLGRGGYVCVGVWVCVGVCVFVWALHIFKSETWDYSTWPALDLFQLGPIPPYVYLALTWHCSLDKCSQVFPIFLPWPLVLFYAKSRIKTGIGMEGSCAWSVRFVTRICSPGPSSPTSYWRGGYGDEWCCWGTTQEHWTVTFTFVH